MRLFEEFASSIILQNKINMEKLDTHIENYFAELILLNRILKQNDKELEKYTSKKFNTFRYVKLNENLFSDIIIDILNPEGEHGQGNAFLQSFCSFLDLKKHEKKIIYQPEIKREVYTKQSLNKLRRMDILIDWTSFGIMIENKPKHSDEDNQLTDYAKDLKNKYGENNFIIVFMSMQDRHPSENSLSKKEKDSLISKKQYFHFTYENDFEKWINNCVNICQSEKYRHFLKDFSNYILTKYLKN